MPHSDVERRADRVPDPLERPLGRAQPDDAAGSARGPGHDGPLAATG